MANFIVVMGVSGAGKSSIGKCIATELNYQFIEGDELHTEDNILKMSQGIPLTDDDRFPWLMKIQLSIKSLANKNRSAVIACSSLKKSYRDIIREASDNLIFIFLDGSYEVIQQRLISREGHFMKDNLLTSQFNTLEIPHAESDVITLSISHNQNELIALSITKIEEIFN